jgi:hypothetical protein
VIPEIGIKAYHHSFHPILNEFYAMHIRIFGFLDFFRVEEYAYALEFFQAFGVLVDWIHMSNPKQRKGCTL